VSELRSALDALTSEDLHAMVSSQVLDRIALLVETQNRIAAELARAVRHGELTQAPEHDGLKTMGPWLRGHCRLSPTAAAQVVRNGRALEHLPAVAAGCADGQITADQVGIIAEITRPERLAQAAEQQVDLAAVDEALAAVAATRSHADLARVVHHYLERLDQDGAEPDPTEHRAVRIAKHPDGSLSARVELDAVGGEKFQAALESLVQANRPAGDLRSRAQQLGDALVQLCDNALASGSLPVLRKNKPHVFLTVGVEDLADPSTNPGASEMGFGATLSAARARWAACDADLTRIVLDPDGQPLDYGRTVRLVPAGLRNVVVHRDKHCVFAGCDAPSHWCDVHHLVEWIFGGETSLENSGLLCERHHTQVHHGFRVERDTAGRWHTYRPDGTEILVAVAAPRAA